MNDDKKIHTPCGQNCQECSHFEKSCKGCMNTGGLPFYIEHTPHKICPIFACVNGKGYLHCGNCDEYPCKKYMDLRDPSMTDNEWNKSVKDRKNNLISRRKKSN